MPSTHPLLTRAARGVLLGSFPGTTLPDWLVEAVRGGLGGVVLFGENVPDLVTARRLCQELHALSPELVVMIDEEGGDVTRLQAAEGSGLPGNAALGAVDDVDLTLRAGRALGALLHAVGIDVDLGPCLDVASEPWNPVVGSRSFGPDAELVARHGVATVRGLAAGGAGACGKHYPGHGATLVDSHVGLPVLHVDLELLQQRDLLPFRAAVAAGMESVMTAHVVVPGLGERPASLSRWSSVLLRRSGFAGPVVTDALGMKAVGDDLGEAAVAAVRAGADLLCLDAPHQRDAEDMLHRSTEALVAAAAAGVVEVEALRRSAMRNRALGARCALRRERPRLELDRARQQLAEVGAEAADRSLDVRGEVRTSGPLQLVDLRPTQNLAAGRTTSAFTAALTGRAQASGRGEVPTVPATDVDPGRAVVVLVREPHPERPEGRALAELVGRRPDAVVVHTGVAATAPDVPHRVLCHGVGRANAEAVSRRVVG
ncbi:beta-glucosidase [Auraticoccus sp. F435]|uniref:Beta-glucosidase n=1 Tax=Auraticoccus cholistanensis TaxID=2656650 RepID=A0A6A9UQD3_9ACTN|nr:glycoside hydrolase family 3 N-terminal domain-containing protein [Auraticoccus cholistanensis]MVA74943.1 beta-glucosidase [Auraticoccus cholistanensis]